MHIKQALSFEDVLLVPQYSEIKSRDLVSTNINIKTQHADFNFNHPIVPANMKTIIDFEMARAIYLEHGMGLLHRFNSIEDQIDIINKLKELNTTSNVRCFGDPMNYIGCSIGVKKEDKINFLKLKDAGVKIFCIDIAHGDSSLCINMIKYVKSKYPECLLIAGNVATGDGAKRLWNAGADVVKVGIGSGCFAAGTRILMGNGFYKNIEDVQIGDMVINKDGDRVKVTNAFCTGMKKVVKLTTDSFYKDTFVTPDHQFLVKEKSEYKWKAVSEIVENKQKVLFPVNIDFVLDSKFYDKKYFQLLHEDLWIKFGVDGKGLLRSTQSDIEAFMLANYLLFETFLDQNYFYVRKDFDPVEIISCEEQESEMLVYDLTVDCDTHSFIANNIIVHNSICSTRINTGNGVLQLTAIMDVAEARKEYINKYFISDGGIVNVGAIAKALCFADMVMVGSMFSGCSETPGAVLEHNGTKYKSYSGSSTLKATYREGAEALVKLKGSFNDELQKMLQGLRSSMSYQGVSNLTDFKENPQFVQVTAAGLKESHIHTVDIITK